MGLIPKEIRKNRFIYEYELRETHGIKGFQSVKVLQAIRHDRLDYFLAGTKITLLFFCLHKLQEISFRFVFNFILKKTVPADKCTH